MDLWVTTKDLISILSSLVTLISFPVIFYQIKLAKASSRDVNRARVQIYLEVVVEKNRQMVLLTLRNNGQLPARQIQIEFAAGTKFHAMRGAQGYPFLSPSNIGELKAGEVISYRLGPVSGENNMGHVLKNKLFGKLHYLASRDSKPETEPFEITLDKSGFLYSRNYF